MIRANKQCSTANRNLHSGPWLAIGIVVLATFPFVNRAVFLDENLLLQLADSALTKGLWAHQDIATVFFGERLQNLSTHTHPPFVEYFLGWLLHLFGGVNTVWLRVVFAVFPLVAAASFFDLARRFTRHPGLVTALFVSSPAFFVMSPTLMADIPALAFILLGFCFFFHGRLWLSALGFSLGLCSSYTTLLPFVALLGWLILRQSGRGLAILSLSLVPLSTWLVVKGLYFGEIPGMESARYLLSHRALGHNILSSVSFLGAVTTVPWLGFIAFALKRKDLLGGALALGVVSVITMFLAWPTRAYHAAYILEASAGIALLLTFLNRVRHGEESDCPFLLFAIWVFATLAFLIMTTEMIAARYLLLLLPPLYLVCFREMRPGVAIGTLALTFSLSLTVALSDYRLANAYRDWVIRNIPCLRADGFRLWSGTESGLRFYLEQYGIGTLAFDDLRPRGADLVIKQELFTYGLSNELEPLLIKIQSDNLDAFPVRTLSNTAHAGFHDSRYGLLPYVIGWTPLDRITIWQVSPLVKTLPQIVPEDFSTVPVWFPGGVVLKQVNDEMIFNPHLPESAEVLYDRVGKGDIQVSKDRIRLVKDQADPVLWENLRIVPRPLCNR